MKKSKSWIHVCVHFLLFITLGVHSDTLDFNPVTDDISKLSILRQNIPKDYKIPVEYIPKQEGGMCWVKLNVYYLEQSLDGLANKFGNISSNRNDIRIVIDMLKELRHRMGNPDPIMLEFQCHYRKERWQTEQYFDFVEDFFTAAQNKEYSDDCDPPPCPTTPYTLTTEEYSEGSPTPSTKDQECSTNCQAPYKQPILLPKVVEQSLLSLLFIPLLALIFLLVWKVRSRRREEDPQRNPGERVLFTGTQGTAPPIEAETSEKNTLNVIETV
ncbi:kit ligand a [Melanotaenia boesemani]|uniref:kit ligand a n=1 Tax=Melanotaenia boesemani TaxID=1250792 RepID=UPI001C05CF7C|nr:kit ligand a [Melanotaenia boesemani]XP_041853792.1 kit ligand a [Melanotaenia boesemani]